MNRCQVAKLAPADRLAMRSERNRRTGCVEYRGTPSTGGYRQITVAGRSVFAHRLAYELVHGPIPDGMKVCHSCDNPACINVTHLWLGTQRQNIQDAIAKGRMWWQRSAAA